MSNTYVINLQNKMATQKTLWLFLQEPEVVVSSEVFANSSTYLILPTYEKGDDNSFSVPLQYITRAGSETKAPAPNVLITSGTSKNTDLETAWEADYALKNQQPLLKSSGTAPEQQVVITTNSFDPDKEKDNDWYHNLTFGVQTSTGFTGVTWSPEPGTDYHIKPKVRFYVAASSEFQSNELFSMSTVSSHSQEVTEDNFDSNLECTVILHADGSWEVQKGNLNKSSAGDTELLLLQAHYNLTAAHADIVKNYGKPSVINCAGLPAGISADDEFRTSAGIEITTENLRYDGQNNFLKGIIKVTKSVTNDFAYIVVKNTYLNIKGKSKSGNTSWEFTYDGSKNAKEIDAIFGKGHEVDFTNTKPK